MFKKIYISWFITIFSPWFHELFLKILMALEPQVGEPWSEQNVRLEEVEQGERKTVLK